MFLAYRFQFFIRVNYTLTVVFSWSEWVTICLVSQVYDGNQMFLLSLAGDLQWNPVIERVQKSYMAVLQQYVKTHYPYKPKRYGELLLSLHYIQSASSLLLNTKMIYIPFLLNSPSQTSNTDHCNTEWELRGYLTAGCHEADICL